MSTEIREYESTFESLRQQDENGEYWSARDLMPVVDYRDWRNFNDIINKAMTALLGLGEDTRRHFSVLSPKTPSEQGGRPRADFRLSRRACYLVFMNGDPKKPAIAAAQNYFAEKTRKMEIIEQQPAAVAMPTHVDALRGWADALEAREKAELQTLQAQAEADLLRPPAEAWTHLADVGQDYSVREACYILRRDPAITNVGPQKLFRWIVDNKMAERRPDGQYLPYAAHMDHLRLRIQTRPDYDDNVLALRKEANSQLRVTVKGLEWMQQRLRDQGKPDLTGRIPRQPLAPPTEDEMEEPEAEDAPIDFDKYRRAALASQLKR